jgi:hypothetical protein
MYLALKKTSNITVKSEGSFFNIIFLKKNNFFWECLLFNSKVLCILIKEKSIQKIFWINFLFKSFLFEILNATA